MRRLPSLSLAVRASTEGHTDKRHKQSQFYDDQFKSSKRLCPVIKAKMFERVLFPFINAAMGGVTEDDGMPIVSHCWMIMYVYLFLK